MKNIKASLYGIPYLLMILFLIVTGSGAATLNDPPDYSDQSMDTLGGSIEQRITTEIYMADTFPLFSLFTKRKKKKVVEEEIYNSLFPDSKSYLKPYECNIVFDGTDPLSGERKKELASEPFLSYTDPNLKPYFPGKDLLQASAQTIKFSGGYIYVSIKFEWSAKNPNASYGRLKANGAIRCHLTDGKSVTLYNNKESIWHKKDDDNLHTLQALYLLHPRQIKLLKEHSIMKLTVYWERGFEEYPIYPITIFMNQLECLE